MRDHTERLRTWAPKPCLICSREPVTNRVADDCNSLVARPVVGRHAFAKRKHVGVMSLRPPDTRQFECHRPLADRGIRADK